MSKLKRSIAGALCMGVAVCVIGLTGMTTAKAAEAPEGILETTGQTQQDAIGEITEHEFVLNALETAMDLAHEEPYVYEYMGDLTQLSGFTAEELESLVADTGLAGLGAYYAEKEKTHEINALFLIAVAKLESGFGKSNLAKNSNNLGGLKNGNGGYMKFDSKEDCIEYQATLLRDNYLSEDGKYYAGKTTKGVSKYYCEGSSSWYKQVEGLMKKGYYTVMEAREAAQQITP